MQEEQGKNSPVNAPGQEKTLETSQHNGTSLLDSLNAQTWTVSRDAHPDNALESLS